MDSFKIGEDKHFHTNINGYSFYFNLHNIFTDNDDDLSELHKELFVIQKESKDITRIVQRWINESKYKINYQFNFYFQTDVINQKVYLIDIRYYVTKHIHFDERLIKYKYKKYNLPDNYYSVHQGPIPLIINIKNNDLDNINYFVANYSYNILNGLTNVLNGSNIVEQLDNNTGHLTILLNKRPLCKIYYDPNMHDIEASHIEIIKKVEIKIEQKS